MYNVCTHRDDKDFTNVTNTIVNEWQNKIEREKEKEKKRHESFEHKKQTSPTSKYYWLLASAFNQLYKSYKPPHFSFPSVYLRTWLFVVFYSYVRVHIYICIYDTMSHCMSTRALYACYLDHYVCFIFDIFNIFIFTLIICEEL